MSNFSYIKIKMAGSRRVAVRSAYEKESAVRGHHIYKASWMPSIGEELSVDLARNCITAFSLRRTRTRGQGRDN